jgi:tellurium resistance protein TerZ
VIELTQGQEWVLATQDDQPLTRLRMGVGWDKEKNAGFIGSGAPDVDLDASAVAFAGGQYADMVFYNNLRTRDGAVVHLGDNQSGRGEGDDEVITVDLTAVHPKIDTIVFLVSSYQGHTLEWIRNAYCRLVDVRGEEDVELARVRLTNGVPQTGMAMAKLVRDGQGWKLRAIGEGIAVKVPSESVEALRPFL